jgi:hypothetical protein
VGLGRFSRDARGSGRAPFTFKILFLWERIAGEWWCKGDMYVVDKSSAPAAGSAQH